MFWPWSTCALKVIDPQASLHRLPGSRTTHLGAFLGVSSPASANELVSLVTSRVWDSDIVRIFSKMSCKAKLLNLRKGSTEAPFSQKVGQHTSSQVLTRECPSEFSNVSWRSLLAEPLDLFSLEMSQRKVTLKGRKRLLQRSSALPCLKEVKGCENATAARLATETDRSSFLNSNGVLNLTQPLEDLAKAQSNQFVHPCHSMRSGDGTS